MAPVYSTNGIIPVIDPSAVVKHSLRRRVILQPSHSREKH